MYSVKTRFFAPQITYLLVIKSVGNVPYNMGEDTLIDVFKKVGQVVGFRYECHIDVWEYHRR